MKGVIVEPLPLIFSFLFFLICGSYIYFGCYIVSVNSKEKSNRLFFVLCIFLSVWAFSLAMSISAVDQDASFFWRRVSALGWCTFAGILLHFFLVLTDKKKLLKKWWIYFLIYIPGTIFVYIFSLSYDLAILQYNLIDTPVGWKNNANNNLWNMLGFLYNYGYIIIGMSVLWHWGQHSGKENNKKMAKLILIGFAVSLLMAIILVIMGQLFFSIGATQKVVNIMFVATLSIFYGIKKYKLVRMPPVDVDEIILNNLTRTKIYNYLSICFVAGSFLNLLVRYFLENQDELSSILYFSGLLLGFGIAIQLAQRIEPLKRLQNYIIMALIGISIPIISCEFLNVVSLTVWAVPFILILFGLVYNNRIAGLFKYAFIVDGQEFYISAKAGIAIYPKDGEVAEELLKNADIAMYKAKEKGKNSYVVCSAMIKDEVNFKNKLTGNLYHALENNELAVYYQPQICLKTGKIVAVEALLRWHHPELGMIPPRVIIPLAEQTGLINPIGEWVLETACHQNKQWQDGGLPPIRVAVNISATQFRNPLLISQLKKLLKESDLKPSYLELELTENIAIHKSSYIISVLNGLKRLGLFISIDDFGTEYSSLSRLKLLPIDQIKIDKQFIDGIAGNKKDQAIVNTIIQLAKNLGLSVIAEGAETEAQINFLKDKKCDTVQGFFYYKPMPAAEMETILRQTN